MTPPNLRDVLAARARVYRVVRPTPLLRHPLLAAETGLDIWVKHENHNPTCSFKVRGGLNLVASLPPDERRGVISASTGNHGQSIALRCRARRRALHDRHAARQQSRQERGDARVGRRGRSSSARTSTKHARKSSRCSVERGLRYVHSAERAAPHRRRRAPTRSRSSRRCPMPTSIIVPIGGGSGACGLRARAHGAREPRRRSIGVQAERADAFARSWKTRQPHRRRLGRHVCRGHGHASDLRSDLRHPRKGARRCRDAERRGAGRRRPARACGRRTTSPKARAPRRSPPR